ncbi:hypothetical protein APHAL10511_006840 [Amanita phalloides]|nr:hypothetical protein APHAL10511_006840 [Amanita phalloides]
MAPHLRVLAGPCPNTLVPVTNIVNSSTSYKVSSDLFEGEIAVHIKDFIDEEGVIRHSDYFQREDRQGVTWSIQVTGRFLEPRSADDILFGNVFDRPLYMPWGSSVALGFMQYIDPTLEHDLYSQTKPWALSPLISTMPHFAHRQIEDDLNKELSIDLSWNDFTGELYRASIAQVNLSESSTLSAPSTREKSGLSPDKLMHAGGNETLATVKEHKKRAARAEDFQFESAAQRRNYFSKAEHRQAIQFGSKDIISTDFCYGFLEFDPTIALRLPGGLSFDLTRYWDGQPVKFVCFSEYMIRLSSTPERQHRQTGWRWRKTAGQHLLPASSHAGMNDHNRSSGIQLFASKFIQKIALLGPRFKSSAQGSRNESARFPFLQHRKCIKSEADASRTSQDDESNPNKFTPQPFSHLDSMLVEPFIPDMRPTDGDVLASRATPSPDAQRSPPRIISTRTGYDITAPGVTTGISKAINSNENWSDGYGGRAAGQADNVTLLDNIPGIRRKDADSKNAPKHKLGADDEDDVPLMILKEAHHQPTAKGGNLTDVRTMGPVIVISHFGDGESHDATVPAATNVAAGFNREAPIISPQPLHKELAQPHFGIASPSTSFQTIATDSTSTGPSFVYSPTASAVSSPSLSRPSPKLIMPSTPPRVSSRLSRRMSVDRDGNLSSLRFSPSIVTRHPPLPLKLPTLPPLSPIEAKTSLQDSDSQRRDRRARIRSMPALPRSGSGRGAGGHEEEDEEEGDDMDDMIEEDDDDILQGDEEGRALSRIDRSDAMSSSSAGSSSVRNSSRASSYATAPHEQESHQRGNLGEILPQMEATKLDLSFLDMPPTPIIEMKGKGKARDNDIVTPTERLQKGYFSSVMGAAADASLTTLVSTKRLSVYPRQRRSMSPMHTPMPGFATLKTLPLPPLADAERPGMYKHASQSMIDIHLKPHEEPAPVPVSDVESEVKGGGTTAEERGKEKRLSRVSVMEELPSPNVVRRRRSMPSYYGPTSPPPPYPTFGPFQRPLHIQPREEEGRERLPPYTNDIYLKAIMPRKMEFALPGIQAKDRKWRRVICVLEGTMFRVYRCPPKVAGVSAIEGWWERKVGVGDVSISGPPYVSATNIIHGPTIQARQRRRSMSPHQKAKKQDEQMNQTSAMAGGARIVSPEPKRSKLAVPFLRSGRMHKRSQSELVSGSTMPQSRERPTSRAPSLDAGDLIKTYTLQHAECGLGLDYTKRKNVIRMKMEGEQFLVQAKNAMEVVSWIEGIQSGTNVALELDERPMPRGPLFPRRRRRRRV